jgi:CheY-like chemotaxis protein
VGTPLACSILETGKPALANDPAQVQAMRKTVSPAIEEAVGFPVRVGNRLVGILEFLSDRRHPRSDTLPDLLGNLEHQLSHVFERREADRALRELRNGRALKAAPMRLPRISGDFGVGESGEVAGADTGGQSGPTQGGVTGKLVLLVEGDEGNAQLGAWLASLGCETQRADDPDRALEMLKRHPFDVVLIDLQGVGRGLEGTIGAIRNDERLRGTILLALTSNIFPDMKERVRSAGFDGFLTKPLQRADLEATLRRLLEIPLPG